MRISRCINLKSQYLTCNLHKINHSRTLASRLELNFSHSFAGPIWKMVSLPLQKLLILEIRDETSRQVSFTALNYQTNTTLWENFKLTESWWVSLLAGRNSHVLIQKYLSQDNPVDMGIIVMDVQGPRIVWERDNFSFSGFDNDVVIGVVNDAEHTTLRLELITGEVINAKSEFDFTPDEISDTLRPFQYQENTDYFKTVYDFLRKNFSICPEYAVEYLEYDGLIIISYYIRDGKELLNYLLVVDESGKMLLQEKLDAQLKGLGVDTFFVLSGCLFFVRDKRYLLSYKIV